MSREVAVVHDEPGEVKVDDFVRCKKVGRVIHPGSGGGGKSKAAWRRGSGYAAV